MVAIISGRGMSRPGRFNNSHEALLTCEAQVYKLDSNAGPGDNQWIELTAHPVPIHIHRDQATRSYRLLCVNRLEVVVNFVIDLTINVSKSSCKFSHWSTYNPQVTYGFGFVSEADNDKFVSQIKGIQEETKKKFNAGPMELPALQNGTCKTLRSNSSPQALLSLPSSSEHDKPTTSMPQILPLHVEKLARENEQFKAALMEKSEENYKLMEKLVFLEQQIDIMKNGGPSIDGTVSLKEQNVVLHAQIMQMEKERQSADKKLHLMLRLCSEYKQLVNLALNKIHELQCVLENEVLGRSFVMNP